MVPIFGVALPLRTLDVWRGLLVEWCFIYRSTVESLDDRRLMIDAHRTVALSAIMAASTAGLRRSMLLFMS
jgi:hypothetical protein